MGGTAVLNPGILLTRYLLFEHLHEARFPNAGLTVDQHHLAQPILDLGPALPEEGHFGVAPDQRCQASDGPHVEPGLGLARVQHPIHPQWVGQPFEVLHPQGMRDKIALHQARCRLTDDDGIRGRQALEAGRDIRRLP